MWTTCQYRSCQNLGVLVILDRFNGLKVVIGLDLPISNGSDTRQGENGSTEPITKTSRTGRLGNFRVRSTDEHGDLRLLFSDFSFSTRTASLSTAISSGDALCLVLGT